MSRSPRVWHFSSYGFADIKTFPFTRARVYLPNCEREQSIKKCRILTTRNPSRLPRAQLSECIDWLQSVARGCIISCGIICWTTTTRCRLCIGMIELRRPCDGHGLVGRPHQTGLPLSSPSTKTVSEFNLSQTQATHVGLAARCQPPSVCGCDILEPNTSQLRKF